MVVLAETSRTSKTNPYLQDKCLLSKNKTLPLPLWKQSYAINLLPCSLLTPPGNGDMSGFSVDVIC